MGLSFGEKGSVGGEPAMNDARPTGSFAMMARRVRFAIAADIGTNGKPCERGQRRGPRPRHDRSAVVFHRAAAYAKVCRDVLARLSSQDVAKHLMLPRGQTTDKVRTALRQSAITRAWYDTQALAWRADLRHLDIGSSERDDYPINGRLRRCKRVQWQQAAQQQPARSQSKNMLFDDPGREHALDARQKRPLKAKRFAE